MLRLARMEVAQVCNPTGGECEESRCCGGVKCVDFGGNAGKFCGGDMTVSIGMNVVSVRDPTPDVCTNLNVVCFRVIVLPRVW